MFWSCVSTVTHPRYFITNFSNQPCDKGSDLYGALRADAERQKAITDTQSPTKMRGVGRSPAARLARTLHNKTKHVKKQASAGVDRNTRNKLPRTMQ